MEILRLTAAQAIQTLREREALARRQFLPPSKAALAEMEVFMVAVVVVDRAQETARAAQQQAVTAVQGLL